MAYNNKATLKDVDGNPISQYFNPTLDRYEPVEGMKGGNKVILYNENGTQNNSLSLLPILGKLDQLAGSVVDEVQRQSNEVARLALYNDMQSKLSSGYFKGAKGDKGDKGEQGIQGIQGIQGLKGDIGLTGQRGEKGNPFVYSDFTQPQLDLLKVKGDKGDKGDVGERGEKGEKGDPFKYTDFTQAQLLGLKGDKGDTGQRGIQGEQGIQGDKGEKGDTGEVENLTPTHITEALGYTPVDTTDSRLSDARTPLAHSQAINTITGLQSALDGKVNNSQVLTNVPANAKFTDTIVDISGKADINYVDNKVKTDVPLGAKFTDTIYTHPTTHPASMITGLPTSLPASGGNADTVGGFTVGVNVPSNANFSNTTYTEISTAEIDLGTASTLRTITARRVKYVIDKIVALFPSKTSELENDSGFLTSVTKSDVGLGDVTNDKQMPISGGTFTGQAKFLNDTSYGVFKGRNIASGTANPSGGSNGDIYFKRKV